MKKTPMYYSIVSTKFVINTVVKITFFGLLATFGMMGWHYFKGVHVEEFAHYFEDSVHMSIIMDAIKAFVSDSWNVAVEDTEEVLLAKEEDNLYEAGKKFIALTLKGIVK